MTSDHLDALYDRAEDRRPQRLRSSGHAKGPWRRPNSLDRSLSRRRSHVIHNTKGVATIPIPSAIHQPMPLKRQIKTMTT
ncbi:hypothetical protein V2W30_36815 [Streptomyces sp. Q6]|uniref:Uncharacterized protein n=1 Tax=Streptomyces citrinus TaxID=3118173 RepID=A0ACD5AMC5_9ACTN